MDHEPLLNWNSNCFGRFAFSGAWKIHDWCCQFLLIHTRRKNTPFFSNISIAAIYYTKNKIPARWYFIFSPLLSLSLLIIWDYLSLITVFACWICWHVHWVVLGFLFVSDPSPDWQTSHIQSVNKKCYWQFYLSVKLFASAIANWL